MKERAREFRKNQTLAENKLWFVLRKRRFSQYKFRRQHVIGPYIVDFVCLKKKLVIEIDGSQHLDNQEHDAARTFYLNQKGFRVIRFWNNQVLKEMNFVLQKVHQELFIPSSARFRSRSSWAPSPQQVGEKG